MKCPEKGNLYIETEIRLVIAKCRGGGMGMTVKGYRSVFSGWGKCSWIKRYVCPTLWIC